MYERSCADFGGLVEEGSVADAPPSVEIYTLLAGAIDAASATDLHSFATRRVGVAQHLSPRSRSTAKDGFWARTCARRGKRTRRRWFAFSNSS